MFVVRHTFNSFHVMSPSRPKLYNPKLVCACALLFTPIFGALLQARNWEEMGIPENARASRVWVRSTVWLIVVYLVLQAECLQNQIDCQLAWPLFPNRALGLVDAHKRLAPTGLCQPNL